MLTVTLTTGKAGCRTVPLLSVVRNEVWIFFCKNVLSKSNHTDGGEITEYNAQGNSRIRLRFILRKARFYARVHLKKTFSKPVFE